ELARLQNTPAPNSSASRIRSTGGRRVDSRHSHERLGDQGERYYLAPPAPGGRRFAGAEKSVQVSEAVYTLRSNIDTLPHSSRLNSRGWVFLEPIWRPNLSQLSA